MRSRPFCGRTNCRLGVEALAAGLAYGAGLCWASACLVASIRPADLSSPYWHGVQGLRTDTTGIVAFFAVGVCFATSEYLRLRRCRDATERPRRRWSDETMTLLALATSETVAILATGLVVYLSVNAVTHPATLAIRATHLTAWPTEGSLRMVALLMCVCSVTVRRYLSAETTRGRGGGPPVPPSIEGLTRSDVTRA